MNIKILSALLAAAILASGCQNSSYIEKETYQSQLESPAESMGQELPDPQDIQLQSGEVSLKETEDGTAIQVIYGTRSYVLPFWIELDSQVWPVNVQTEDFTGRGNKELSIIWTSGSGTGIHIEDIFLMDLDKMEQISIYDVAGEDYSFLRKNPAFVQASADEELEWLGNYAEYHWSEDGNLIFAVSAETGDEKGPGAFKGDFQVTLRFDGDGFVPEEKVEWKPE